MTRHPEPNVHDEAAHHWLTQHQHALTRTLDDLLDTEAGLREILLHSRHDTATDNLDTVLDTEAGLAAILPTPPTSPAGTYETPPYQTSEFLRALSPAGRLALRNNPDVKSASQALARDLACDRDDDADAVARSLDLAHDLADAVARRLPRDLSHASDIAVAVARDLDLDRARARDRALALARDLTLARDRALALARDLTLACDIDRELARDRGLDFARDLDLGLALDRVHDLARALDFARNLITSPVVTRALDLIVEVRTAEVGRAIGLALRRKPFVLDKDLLHALLDDFTTTDLSNADLTGIDLSGVRWSEHTTHWPLTIDVESLKSRSDETPLGSGTWIVRSGTATIRDLAGR